MQLRCWLCAGLADCIVQHLDLGPGQDGALVLQADCTDVLQAIDPWMGDQHFVA